MTWCCYHNPATRAVEVWENRVLMQAVQAEAILSRNSPFKRWRWDEGYLDGDRSAMILKSDGKE